MIFIKKVAQERQLHLFLHNLPSPNGIDPIRYEALILELLEKKKDVCRADVVELVHVTPSQAFRILKKMADKGKIQLVGKGAGAKYVLK